MSTSEEIKRLDSENVMHTYARFDVAIERGSGSTLYSPEGVEYIDFSSGIGVNSIGYGNEKWISAITEQASKLGHMSNLFYTEPCAKLAARLREATGMGAVFFANSGAEANEGLIKLARKYSFDKYGAGRANIITLRDSFHGRTVTTLSATGQKVFHNYFFPFTGGFHHTPANDLQAINNIIDGRVCAVMVELVQGEGGVVPLNLDFVQKLAAICRTRDILFLVDEVQTGAGRTGTMFAFQQFGITPDALSFAKGIGGGMPLSGIITTERLKNVLGPGTHATTFGGNPVSCAAALAVLDVLTPEVLGEVVKKGEYIKNAVLAINSPHVVNVRGLGLMIGIGIKNAAHKTLAAKCIANGLLILTAGHDSLRLLPPLTITYEEIDKGLAILKKTLEELE